MIIQNLNTISPTNYLKEDNLVLDINTRLSNKELYEKILAGEDISDIAVINAYRRTGKDILFEPYRPPFESASLDQTKVTVTEFEGYLYQKAGYETSFEQIPVWTPGMAEPLEEDVLTRKQLLDYLSIGMDILPELEDKQSLSLEDKIKLSETAQMFYINTQPISPFNPLPSYEDLTFYSSLSKYEQRLLRNPNSALLVSPVAMAIARYCKDEKINGFGPLFINEFMLEGLLESNIKEKVEAYADFDRYLFTELTSLRLPELSEPVFRAINGMLSDKNLLYAESTGIQRIRALFSNHWIYNKSTVSINQSFNSHDLEGTKAILKQELRNAGCLLPANKLQEVIQGGHTPAEIDDWIEEHLTSTATKFLEEGLSTDEDFAAFVKREIAASYPISKPVLENEIEALFKESFGRAPKILHDLVCAFQLQHAHELNTLTKEDYKQIVENFNLKNLQAILKYHSHTLFNLSRHIDFTSIKPAYLEILATKNLDVNQLEKKGFFEWFSAQYKHTSVSEFHDLLSCEIEHFDMDKSAKELTKRSRLKDAYAEVEKIRNTWHINFEDNDVAVRGRDIVVTDGKWTAEICDKDDPRQVRSGYDTNCCQRLGGAGESCVRDILVNPLSCNLIITDNRTGEIVAQSYVWSDVAKDALVLDNMEFRVDHDATAKKFFPLVAKWCEQMPQKNIHIGTGYCQSFKGVGIPTTTYDGCHRTVLGEQSSHWYSDYHITGANAARILKKDGLITFPASEHAEVSRKELKSSALEEVCGEEDIPLFGLPTIKTAQDIVTYKEKATAGTDEEWIRTQINVLKGQKKFELLRFFTTIPDDLQEQIFTADNSAVEFIQNPSDSVLRKYLTLNPAAIGNYPNLNPEIIKHLYAQNGLLVRKAPPTDLECQKAAVRNEPLAILYLKDSPIFDELLLLAIQKKPTVIKFFPDADDSFWNKAIYRDPFLIKYRPRPTRWQKETAIKSNPAVVYSIRNAKPEDFALARNILKNYRQSDPTESNEMTQNSYLSRH